MKENQNIEFKSSWRDEYLKWICGFANAGGGRLYVGINDQGEVIGLSNYKTLAEEIPNKIISHLGVSCEINLLEKNQIVYLEIVVPPYEVAISFKGKYYFRSGSTLQELKGISLNDFLMRKSGKTWDESIDDSATIDELNPEAVNAFKSGAVKSYRLPNAGQEADLTKLLVNLRLMEGKNLKRAAILLFGKDPQKYHLTAYLKIGRFGVKDSDLLSQELISGNIFEMADSAMEILDKKYFRKSISYNGLHRIETPEYPYEAVREILLMQLFTVIIPALRFRLAFTTISLWYGILELYLKTLPSKT